MKHLWPLVLMLILTSCMTSQRTIFLKPPPLDKVDTVDVARYERTFGKYDGVYLEVDHSIEHSGTSEGYSIGSSSWKYTTVLRRKYIVFNPDIESLTTFKLRASKKATIGTLYLQMTPPGGLPRRYEMKDLIQESVSEYGVNYKFIYPNVVKGTIIEEGFEITHNGYMSSSALGEDIPLQFTIPCDKISFTYAIPDWWEVQVKKIGVTDSIPYKVWYTPEFHKQTIYYTAYGVPALKDEPYDPFFKEVAKYFQCMVTKITLPGVDSRAPNGWAELASRSREYLTQREGKSLFSSRVESTTKDIVSGKETPLDKLAAIVDFVQSNIDPARDGKERDFADVVKDKKGSAYEINGLTNMMLKKAGIQSEFMMVHSAAEGYFDSTYHSFDQLSIPVVDAWVAGKEYVILPYRKGIQYDIIPDHLQGQVAMAISSTSDSRLTTIPTGVNGRNQIQEEFDLTIGADGIVSVRESKSIDGSFARYLREYFADMKQSERDKFLKELISYSEGQVKIDTCILENEKDHKKPLLLRYAYSIDNLVTLTPDEVLFHTAGLFAPTSLKRFRVEAEDRDNPIRIYFDEDYGKAITLRFPENWELKMPPPQAAITNAFGSLTRELTLTGHTLTVKQSRLLKRSAAPREKIGELAELTGSKSKVILPTLMFTRKP